MNKNEIITMLSATPSPKQIAQWLRTQYFPEIVSRFNHESSRKRFGLYQNEQLPANERNLTDVRTRMGVLIEFELARISNDLLPEMGITDIFWSYVVANRFPDLEVRRNSGERLLRLEIKCLQCIAEEKSANFDTLMKDIDPRTDYVVVCLWDWNNASSPTYAWDSVPQIYKIYIFHAYSLTALRDAYWLNKPPANIGDGYQGFDARYAVTCSNGHYSKEQGNYGKLTRIWKKGFAYRPAETEELLDTENEYLSFQKEIIATGFEILSKSHLRQLTNDTIEEIIENGNIIGYKANQFAYVQSNVRQILSFAQNHNATIVVTMTEKYRSNVYKIGATTVEKVADNEKPKRLLSIISQL